MRSGICGTRMLHRERENSCYDLTCHGPTPFVTHDVVVCLATSALCRVIK
jgi:hypothetical protein